MKKQAEMIFHESFVVRIVSVTIKGLRPASVTIFRFEMLDSIQRAELFAVIRGMNNG